MSEPSNVSGVALALANSDSVVAPGSDTNDTVGEMAAADDEPQVAPTSDTNDTVGEMAAADDNPGDDAVVPDSDSSDDDVGDAPAPVETKHTRYAPKRQRKLILDYVNQNFADWAAGRRSFQGHGFVPKGKLHAIARDAFDTLQLQERAYNKSGHKKTFMNSAPKNKENWDKEKEADKNKAINSLKRYASESIGKSTKKVMTTQTSKNITKTKTKKKATKIVKKVQVDSSDEDDGDDVVEKEFAAWMKNAHKDDEDDEFDGTAHRQFIKA